MQVVKRSGEQERLGLIKISNRLNKLLWGITIRILG